MSFFEYISRLSRRQKFVLTTLLFGGIIWGFTGAIIVLSFSMEDPVFATMGSLVDGAVIAYWVGWYYFRVESMNIRDAKTAMSKKIQDRVLALAIYIAATNRQGIFLEKYPIAFFKRHGIDSVRIHTGCSVFGKMPDVEFELIYDFNIVKTPGEKVVFVRVNSRKVPVELAPDWLLRDKEYKKAINEAIEELEKEIKGNCKEGSLDKLRRATVHEN